MALLIANASHSLDKQLERIHSAYERAVTITRELLQLEGVDVVCIADASIVIPEIGIGGYTPNRNLVYLYIDPDFDPDEKEIYNTLCHELHHAKRYEGMGYGETLFDSMVFEGLAVAFEEEVSGPGSFMPKELLSRRKTDELLTRVKGYFDDKDFEHFRWFISDSSGELPRWTGYELGYYLVRQYLAAHKNKKASELVLEVSSSFAL